MKALTDEHKAAMRGCANGADIFGRAEAILLREVEKEWPEYVNITEPMIPHTDVMKPRAYFGCILSAKGKAACGVVSKRGPRKSVTS